MKQTRKNRRGFTLTETALMLGVASLVFAAIWAAGSAVWKNYQVDRTLQQVSTIAQNAREYYASLGGLRDASGNDACSAGEAANAGKDITSLLDDPAHRLLPTDMMDSANSSDDPVNHALASSASGSYHFLCVLGGTAFRQKLTNLTREGCAKILLGLPLLDPNIRIDGLQVNGTYSTIDPLSVNNPGGTIDLPLTITNAQALCNKSDDSNSVIINYAL